MYKLAKAYAQGVLALTRSALHWVVDVVLKHLNAKLRRQERDIAQLRSDLLAWRHASMVNNTPLWELSPRLERVEHRLDNVRVQITGQRRKRRSENISLRNELLILKRRNQYLEGQISRSLGLMLDLELELNMIKKALLKATKEG